MTRLFGTAGLITFLLSSAVAAGPMMLPGSEPDVGFAGVWRVIGARPAPWAKQRRLTGQAAPLLEFAVEFTSGEVNGPAPLTCKSAKYSSGVTYLHEAFGGALGGDKDQKLVNQLHLSGFQFSTHRVICGNDVRDFYTDDNADLVTVQGDIVYTLERPTGMDPGQYKVGYSGPSFDCTAAKTTGERLVCIDAALSKLDKKLGESYNALKRNSSPKSFATFASAQRAWLAYVIDSCGTNVPMPETLGDRNVITDCLHTEYDDRANLFDGLTADKAGTLVLEPRMRFRANAKAHIQESDIYPWMSGGGPLSAAFNTFVFKTLMLGRWRTDEKDLFRPDVVGQVRLVARRVYTAVRFDGRIVSFQVSTDDYTGGNHDALEQRSFTWDLAKARLVKLGDVFAASGDWKTFVAGLCKAELHRQFSEREAPDLGEAEITDTLAESRNWLWGIDKATVVFLIGTISGLTGGEFDVDIPLDALKPYMKPDAPVR
ncbi:MAG: lysozyme inhibitor LprI family protein [Steroidobacteraceae bacterium]